MKLLIFGVGAYYQQYKKYLTSSKIVAFLDNDVKKQGQYLDGTMICSPSEGINKIYDRIYILSQYEEEMYNQLLALGVSDKLIYNRYDICDIWTNVNSNMKIHGYVDFDKYNEKSILLISHDMSLSGAPIVLFYIANILKKNGYTVTVAAFNTGDMINRFLSENIAVIIDESLQIARLDKINWIRNFSAIFINTVVLNYLLIGCQIKTPVIWFLHEEEQYYTKIVLKNLLKIKQKNIFIYAVSKNAQDIFNNCLSKNIAQRLFYGIPDCYKVKQDTDNNRGIIFAVVGEVMERKAQDIFLRAIHGLPMKYRKKNKFLIIGNNNHTSFGKYIEEQAKLLPEVKLIGKLQQTDMMKMYENISVLVCPSREDPMPVVVTEAMMMYKTCIVADVIGNAEFIQNKKSGLICKAGDYQSLLEVMIWVIEQPEVLPTMGKEARKIYEKHFSMNIFEKNILKIIEQVWKCVD